MKGRPTQVPFTTCHPKLLDESSAAINEAVASFCGESCAVMCASVRKVPLMVRAPPCILKTASSVLTFTDSPGADRKL